MAENTRKEKRHQYYLDHKRYRPDYGFRYNVEISHGLPIEQYDQMIIDQQNKCAICKKSFTYEDRNHIPYIDHDHLTGKIRSLLCHGCNTILGFAEDKIEILNEAINYLRNHHG